MPTHSPVTIRVNKATSGGNPYVYVEPAHGGPGVSARRFRWVAEAGSGIVFIAVQPLFGTKFKKYFHDWPANEIRVTVQKGEADEVGSPYNLIYRFEGVEYTYCEAYGSPISTTPECIGMQDFMSADPEHHVVFAQNPPPEVLFP